MKKIRMLAASLCAVIFLCGFSVTAYAGGGEEYEETTGGYEEVTAVEPEEAETQEPNPFTPSGTGTVTDNATDEDGKEFYTITTPAGNTFYLIIDLERDSDNVYFLDAVTEADLLALAELSGEAVTSAAIDTEQEVDTDAEPTAETETEQPETESNAGMLLLVAAVVLIGGGAAWYFKIYRPKQQRAAESDDDYGDEPDPYDSAGEYGDEADDDGPPWDEDRDGEE